MSLSEIIHKYRGRLSALLTAAAAFLAWATGVVDALQGALNQ